MDSSIHIQYLWLLLSFVLNMNEWMIFWPKLKGNTIFNTNFKHGLLTGRFMTTELPSRENNSTVIVSSHFVCSFCLFILSIHFVYSHLIKVFLSEVILSRVIFDYSHLLNVIFSTFIYFFYSLNQLANSVT